MYGTKYRFMFVVTGAERSGKTYFAIQFANNYARKTGGVIVYNPGQEGDFEDYETITFLTGRQSVEHEKIPYKASQRTQQQDKRRYTLLKGNHFYYFRYKGNTFDIKHFNQFIYEKRKIKVVRLPTITDEGRFFKTLHGYASGCLLINDDFRAIAKNMSDQRLAPLTEIYSTKNHTGKKANLKTKRKGIDIINIFHHPDKVNTEIYDFTTHIVSFDVTRRIKGATADNDDITDALQDAYKELKNREKFSFAFIPVKGENAFNITYKKI